MAATTILQFRLQSPTHGKGRIQAFNGRQQQQQQHHHHQVHHLRKFAFTLLRNKSVPAMATSFKACNLPVKPVQTLKQNTRVLACGAVSTNEPNEAPANSFAYPSLAFAASTIISAILVRVIRALLEHYILLNPSPGGGLASLLHASSPLLFACLSDPFEDDSRPVTAMSVVANGMAKWLDIYSGITWLRVLLSWFPNIPWDTQPLAAIRDLCDPYLNLFRNILPPVYNVLDVSPLLAFTVLGVFSSILRVAAG